MIEYENLYKSNQKLFEEYCKSFEDFLQSGWFVLGNQVSEFEKEFASFVGSKHCIGVASGLDAMILAIDALGLDQGSEIIVPSNTYIATIMAIIRNGMKPVLVEPDILTYNIDPQKIEEQITSKTKALLIVHLYGKPAKMDVIQQICQQHKIALLEDCAQAHDARFKDRQVGSFGIGCFSFYPTKNLGALGDGGAITTDDDDLAEKLKALRNYGSHQKYNNQYLGYNSRLDEIQASFLRKKLKLLSQITTHKRKLASLYLKELASSCYILPSQDPDCFDVYHIFNIRHPQRNQLREYLLHSGIMSEIHYPIPPHRQKAMHGYIQGKYPISEEIHNTTLSLPIAFFHTEEEIYQVIDKLKRWQA
ncbi:DegT/DnrJ/EryC1/StrS family aminotransferase [Helicobacter pametensis]|uniref:DegT/DnrJ/EryC1/StrS family aminotransferase n=1 Tax=Helicobacter pametensis TaxID=95149 RepID=UPI0004878E0D|nr:DegT/DnrJ/EryC1/StrS family aminotransferase [Helicobacter pametensis]